MKNIVRKYDKELRESKVLEEKQKADHRRYDYPAKEHLLRQRKNR